MRQTASYAQLLRCDGRAQTRASAAYHSVRRGDVSDQRASGGRSSLSGWMPGNKGSGAAMTETVGGSGTKIRAREEMAAAAQQATQGGQCALPAWSSESESCAWLAPWSA